VWKCIYFIYLFIQVEDLKVSNLRLEEEAAELAALRAQAALADTLSGQLQRLDSNLSRFSSIVFLSIDEVLSNEDKSMAPRSVRFGVQSRKLSNVGWVTKNLLSRAHPCFEHVKPLVPAAFAVVSTHQPALGPWVMARSPYV
jgi:hypothetical protein